MLGLEKIRQGLTNDSNSPGTGSGGHQSKFKVIDLRNAHIRKSLM